MTYTIQSDRVYCNRRLTPATITVEGTDIIGIDGPQRGEIIDLTGWRVLPGLIDTHMHGGNGVDTMDGNAESIRVLSDYLLSAGVTTFCATTVTSPMDKTKRVLGLVADCMEQGVPGAKLAGTFLEGPYINPKLKGAHPEEFIRDISILELDELIEASRNTILTVALAPEKSGAPEAVEHLLKRGVSVALGHSDATYDETLACVRRGARTAIHVYNAMRPLHHREPGILGASLVTDGFAVELVCDGVHVNPRSMEVVTRCKQAEDIVLITDCMCAGGMADGRYALGELPVIVEGGIARTESGALAGSTLKLIEAVKNMVELVGVPFETALRFATENPARQLGLQHRIGSIVAGKAADLIAVDEDYNVVFVMVDGRIALDQRS